MIHRTTEKKTVALRRAGVAPADLAMRMHPPDDLHERREAGLLPHLHQRQANAPAAIAFVNHSRWVVRCPWCPSAQVCDPADPRFLCAGPDGCANQAVGGAYIPVKFPGKRSLEAIERLLLERADPLMRNWTPGETLEQLRAENKLLAAARGGDL